jgi:hypothetical protein
MPLIVTQAAPFLANLVERCQRFANGAIHGQQQAMSPVLVFSGVGDGAKGVIFGVHLGRYDNVVPHVIRMMCSALSNVHASILHPT